MAGVVGRHPATYVLRGTRAALIDGRSTAQLGGTPAILALAGVLLVPASIALFDVAERWAKKTGRLKRQG